MKWISALVFVCAVSAFAQNEDVLTLTAEGTSKAASSVEAAKEIQAEAVAGTVRNRVLEILGEKRFQKNKTVVENKIVRQASKFIPYISTGTPEQQGDGSWKMSVEMKFSMTSLRKMILDAGLLIESEGPAAILPMVAFIDRGKGSSLRWWISDAHEDGVKILSGASRQLHEAAQVEFSRQGFHLIRPLNQMFSPLPEPFRIEQLTSSDYQFISDFFMAPMIMKGDVRFKDVKEPSSVVLCAIKLQVVHAHSGRTVAEVNRQFEFDSAAIESSMRAKLQSELPDLTKDLATQVYEAWQRGTLNTSQIRLAVRGALTPKQLTEFKSGLMHGLQEVKNVRERLFDGAGEIVFEVDYTGDLGSLTERLKGLKIPSFDTRVGNSTPSMLSIDVKSHAM